MMSVPSARSGNRGAQLGDERRGSARGVRAAHRLQDPRRARLQRQVDVLADGVALGHRRDHRLAEVLRVRAREADALDPVDRVAGAQQLAELGADLGRRSRPHELTFWPSSVISLTPSAASRVTSATISPGRRLCSRPRTAGTMQYAHFELQPIETCTQAWNARSRCIGSVAGEVARRCRSGRARRRRRRRRASRRDAGSSRARTRRRPTGRARRSARAAPRRSSRRRRSRGRGSARLRRAASPR